MQQTRDQKRAQEAFRLVSEVKSNQADYGRQCKHLPALIHECGLAQAIAFLLSKQKDSVVDHLAEIMEIESTPPNGRGRELNAVVTKCDIQRYMHLSRESLACAQWMKRYAEALGLVKEDDNGSA